MSAEEKSRTLRPFIGLEIITDFVTTSYKMTSDDLHIKIKGPISGNTPRKIAMNLSQEFSDTTLLSVADYFGLSYAGSLSYITYKIRQKMLVDSGFRRKIDDLIVSIAIITT